MKCQKCGSENVEIVSSYIESDQRPGLFIFFILEFINFIIFVAGIATIIAANKQSEEVYVLGITLRALGVILLSFGLYNLLFVFFIGCFRPYRHVTRLIVVCKDCGEVRVMGRLNANFYDDH